VAIVVSVEKQRPEARLDMSKGHAKDDAADWQSAEQWPLNGPSEVGSSRLHGARLERSDSSGEGVACADWGLYGEEGWEG
jgi:hypothetical protein